MNLCLQDLADFTGGELTLGRMPPLAGAWEPVGRIVLAANDIQPGDVLWCLADAGCDWQVAFSRGAAGVVSQQRLTPWPGRFCLQVEDGALALAQIAEALASAWVAEESFVNPPKLKDLQLPAPNAVAIFPPTCERVADSQDLRRCRRAA